MLSCYSTSGTLAVAGLYKSAFAASTAAGWVLFADIFFARAFIGNLVWLPILKCSLSFRRKKRPVYRPFFLSQILYLHPQTLKL
jgi:hypothetical protein